jgi:DNA-binding CsgD family transcriptional regulator
LSALGRRDEAVAAAEQEVENARLWGAPSIVGRSLRVLGEIQRQDGEETLREAVATLDRSPARLERAKARASLGRLHLERDDRGDARALLAEALELAEQCSADNLAEELHALLRSAGARPRRTALSGPESLTISEREVVRLAAGGDSNRNIAEQLFVTPKTVEVHLTNAYRKLGIRSRRELAGALSG